MRAARSSGSRGGAVWIVALVALAPMVVAPERPAAEPDGIVIGTGTLEPRELRTTTERRVVFVNRSGRVVHVEFLGDRSHNLFQVPGSIWAVFHRPGRHAYVVHVSGRRAADLQGVVDVEHDPQQATGLRTCGGLTVMGVCFER